MQHYKDISGVVGARLTLPTRPKFVGCWRALQNPEGKSGDEAINQPLTRAIAFNNTILNSKRLAEHWNGVIESAIEQMPEDQRAPSILNAKRSMLMGSITHLIEKPESNG